MVMVLVQLCWNWCRSSFQRPVYVSDYTDSAELEHIFLQHLEHLAPASVTVDYQIGGGGGGGTLVVVVVVPDF